MVILPKSSFTQVIKYPGNRLEFFTRFENAPHDIHLCTLLQFGHPSRLIFDFIKLVSESHSQFPNFIFSLTVPPVLFPRYRCTITRSAPGTRQNCSRLRLRIPVRRRTLVSAGRPDKYLRSAQKIDITL